MYRDSDITAFDIAVLMDAILHRRALRGWALILLAGIEECECEQ